VVLGQHVSNAQAALLQKARSFILQGSDFLGVRMLDKREAFRILKRTLLGIKTHTRFSAP
jgi:hypothetical protein